MWNLVETLLIDIYDKIHTIPRIETFNKSKYLVYNNKEHNYTDDR